MHRELHYLALLRELLTHGDARSDRTGVGTHALFGRELRFDLAEGFPLLTTKKVLWRSAFIEMLWMLSGGDNIRPLLEHGVRIWTDWPLKRYREATGEAIDARTFEQRILDDADFAAAWGGLGPVYGRQWRAWRGTDGRTFDQVQQVIDLLRDDPTSRRILWDGWNVAELEQMALPPCHKHYQFFVEQATGRLCGAMIQRSADVFLGLPFNLANLALVTHLLARECGYPPGEIVWYGLDVHLYQNHREQARLQLERTPRPWPQLVIHAEAGDMLHCTIDDLDLRAYDPHPFLRADVAV